MFQCDRCGLCCRHISEANIAPDLDRGDGTCKYFDDKTSLCSIYCERPIFCNVDLFYDTYLSSQCSRDDYYLLNYEACKTLKERFGD